MRRTFPSLSVALLLGAGALMTHAVPGTAQDFAKSVELYQGGAKETEGLAYGGWGSGMAQEDRAYKTVGDNSIRVETNGYYAGARIGFTQPKDLTAQIKDPYGFLEFIIRFQPGRPKNQNPGGFGSPGSAGAPGSGGFSDQGGSSAGATGFPGGSGGYDPSGQQTLTPDTKKLKVLLRCDEGTFVASDFPVMLLPSQDEGWFSVAIPFTAFRGLDKAESVHLREIRVFGDNKDTFWIGEIRTTSDDEPISVDSLDALEVSVGDAVEFTASATGGISPLHYSWDFDLSDGLQEDATGLTTIHVFRKPSKDVPGRPGELQPYVVTLTVRDIGGAKKPVRRQAEVTVNP